MQGLRVVPIFRYPHEYLTKAERAIRPSRRLQHRDGSEFALYFDCVLPDLENLVWLADHDSFDSPWTGMMSMRRANRRRAWDCSRGRRPLHGHDRPELDPGAGLRRPHTLGM